VLGLVRAGIAGSIRVAEAYFLHPATCNSRTQRTLAAINTLLYPRIGYDEYDEHAERTYIAEIDEGPNTQSYPSIIYK
jgi:hypothetical protein